jgi:hypothetical protein
MDGQRALEIRPRAREVASQMQQIAKVDKA